MINLIGPLLITALVVTEVGLWQWRMVVAARGHRSGAMLLGTVGAVLQITAISQVVGNLADPFSVGAYALGVGIGVLLGLVAGDRLTPGTVRVTIMTAVPDVAPGLWARGWRATVHAGHGEDGPVSVLVVVVDRRRQARLHRDVSHLDPEAFWSTDDVRLRPPPVDRAAGRPPGHPPTTTGQRLPMAGSAGADIQDGHVRIDTRRTT